jgi:hypothetical protein
MQPELHNVIFELFDKYECSDTVGVFPYDDFINQTLRQFNTRFGYLPLSADKLHTRRCLAQRCLKRSVVHMRT